MLPKPARDQQVMRLALLALMLAASAGAQAQQGRGSLAEPAPRLASPHGLVPKPAQQSGQHMQPCPEYGAGFVRQPGSATCFKLGGGVTLEQQWRGRGSHLADPARTGAQARIGLEARTQTDYGPVRAVIGVKSPLQP